MCGKTINKSPANIDNSNIFARLVRGDEVIGGPFTTKIPPARRQHTAPPKAQPLLGLSTDTTDTVGLTNNAGTKHPAANSQVVGFSRT